MEENVCPLFPPPSPRNFFRLFSILQAGRLKKIPPPPPSQKGGRTLCVLCRVRSERSFNILLQIKRDNFMLLTTEEDMVRSEKCDPIHLYYHFALTVRVITPFFKEEKMNKNKTNKNHYLSRSFRIS